MYVFSKYYSHDMFERLRTCDLLHRQVDETLEPDFFRFGSAAAGRRIPSVVQALQEGCGRNQTWTPDLAGDGCIFEASQLSWTTGIITAFFVVRERGDVTEFGGV